MQLLTGATLIDGTGAPPAPNSSILIDDAGRIAAVGSQGAVAAPPRAEVIDVSGLTVLPGLIDGHDHMASHGYGLTSRWGLDEPQSTTHMRTATVLQQTLGTGYTTVRDAAGLDAGFKLAIDEGLLAGDRPASTKYCSSWALMPCSWPPASVPATIGTPACRARCTLSM